MKKIIEEIAQFNLERDWDQFHSPENLVKSIAIEAGELLECFQWNDEYSLEKVTDELADIFMYAIMLAEKLDLNIEEIIKHKLAINRQRYKVALAKGNSKKYSELEDDH